MAVGTKPRPRRKLGRKQGSQNRGFFFRKGRGWVAVDGKSFVPLRDVNGGKLTEPAESDEVREAFARWLLAKKEQQALQPNKDQTTVATVCRLYLDYCQRTNRPATYKARADKLFDFCSGLPASCRNRFANMTPAEKRAVRLHQGYGELTADELIPLHVEEWLAAHPNWKGVKRMAKQAIKRAFSWGVEQGLLTKSPLKGLKVGRTGRRIVYLTPENELAIYEHAPAALAMLIKVCIQTGARYGKEYSKLTCEHITIQKTEAGEKMTWRFAPSESKNGAQTGKGRTIFIVDPEVIAITKAQMEKHPTGPIFRSRMKDHAKPWTSPGLLRSWGRLKQKFRDRGILLEDAACLYATRHTFAKRLLGGFGGRKPVTLETLAGLMGNSRQICWDHYAQWCDQYQEPLWDALRG